MAGSGTLGGWSRVPPVSEDGPCGLFVILSAAWYFLYVRQRVTRISAVMHIVERVTDRQLQTVTLEDELRDIIFESDEIIEDRFDQLIRNCEIIDIDSKQSSEDAFHAISKILSPRLNLRT